MKRMAILIASPTVNLSGFEPNPVQSATNSIEYWKYLLKTPRLGSWIDRTEIEYRSDWNKQSLKDFIRSLIDIDYIFLVYCGHGARFPKQCCTNPMSEDDLEDYILLNKGREKVRLEEIRAEIASVTDKATMLIEACRGNNWQMPDGATPITVPQDLINEQEDKSREEWMNQLRGCGSSGVVLIQSCSPGGETYANAQFTLFSKAIFDVVESAIFPMNIGDVYNRAYDKTVLYSYNLGEQKPTCYPDSDTVNYPFVLTDGYKIAAQFIPKES